MQTFFIYCRKSSESDDRQALSIESQAQEMRHLAENRNLQVGEVFGESKSAKEPGRPVFNEMMRRLQTGGASGILCWKLDRLARNPVDGGTVIWAVKQHGIRIITPTQTFSPEDDNAILMYMEFGMAQKFVDDLSRNVKRGLQAKAERGWWPNNPPFGYRTVCRPNGTKVITREPLRFPLMRKIWDLMLSSAYTTAGLSKFLERSERGTIGRTSLYRLLRLPFYYGSFEYPRGSDRWYSGRHPAMVSREKFEKVQQLLCRRPRARQARHEFAYTGLIRCGECACAITASTVRNRFGRLYTYYHCIKKRGPCSQPYVRVEALEGQIRESSMSIDPEMNFLSLATSQKRKVLALMCSSATLLNRKLTFQRRTTVDFNDALRRV